MKPSNNKLRPLLQARGLRREASEPGQVAWGPLDVDVQAGVTWVGGGEGRGKTSLLRMLAGDLACEGASLQLAGVSFQTEPARYRRNAFWLDPHTEAWDPQSPRAFFSHCSGQWPAWNSTRAEELAQALGLSPHLDKPLYMLSTGSKRKVWIAAACASGAALTCLDQPLAALDFASVGVVVGLLQDAAAHSQRAWVLADYAAPAGVPLAGSIHLGD